MKINWNKKYTTYAIYAGIVSAAVIVCIFIGVYIKDVWNWARKVADVFAPLLYGVAIAYILNPLMKIFEKTIFRKIRNRMARRGLGVLLTYVVFLSIFGFLVYLIIPQLALSFRELEGSLAKYSQSLQNWLNDISQQAGFLADIVNELEKHIDFSFLSASISELIGIAYKLVIEFSPQISGFLQSFAEQVINIVIGLVFAGYLLCSKELLFAQINKLLHVFFKPERIKKMKNGVLYADKTFGKYLMGALLDAIIVGCITAGGMFVLSFITGMPRQYIALISVIIAFTNIIPIFGPFIGGIPSAIIIFMVSPLKCLIFVIFIILLQQLDGNFIGPKILGNSVGINGFWIMFSIILGTGLFGFMGMLLGVPVFVIIYTAISMLIERKLKRSGLPIHTDIYKTMEGIDPQSGEVISSVSKRRRSSKKNAKNNKKTAVSPKEEKAVEDNKAEEE